jgi:hypothetical protein
LPLETYWVLLEQASWVLGAGCVGFLVVKGPPPPPPFLFIENSAEAF